MTIDRLGPEMIDLVSDLAQFVPPAQIFDKPVYSPWTGSDLHLRLRERSVDTIIITGGETEVCVLATIWARSTGASASFSSPTPYAVRLTRPTTR